MENAGACLGRAGGTGPSRRCGFTLLELLMVIVIILILCGLVMSVVRVLQESSREVSARSMVDQLQVCLDMYQAEDQQGRRLPPVAADGFVRYDTRADTGEAIINLLERHSALHYGISRLVPDPTDARLRVLVDPWSRPYRYAVDGVADGVIARPAPKSEWNARGVEPYGYAWSLGKPFRGSTGTWGGDPDADPANSKNWIFKKTTP